MPSDVVIIGAGINGNLAACHLKQQQPDLDIVVLDKGQSKLPLVGESLTEYSTFFLRELGLGQHLEQRHFHKYGLTFYFKDHLENPQDRTYSVHEAPAVPPMQSALVNRYLFDAELRKRNEEAGVQFINASAVSIHSHDDRFRVATKAIGKAEARASEIDARWVVDCSGRSRFLTKQLGLKQPLSTPQRSSYWFRLVDFDRELLGNLNAIKEGQSSFDSYYTTHHFMGKANWAWCIPMRPHTGHENLMSVGVVWRPDLIDPNINSVQSFVEFFRDQHPVLSEFVESGTFFDQGLYRNYMYECSNVYSSQGWFIVGDAGDTVDPLYSTGVVLSSLQISQVEKMIAADKAQSLTPEFVHDFESAYKSTRSMMQSEVSDFYDVVHDPWQSHWRMYISSLIYFHLMLPAWLAGYMTNQRGARWITQFLAVGQRNAKSLARVLTLSTENPKNGRAVDLPNRYHETINWNLNRGSEVEMHRHLARMMLRLAKYRFLFWRRAGFRDAARQLPTLAQELAGSFLFGIILRGIKPNSLVSRRRRPIAAAPKVGDAKTPDTSGLPTEPHFARERRETAS